MRPLKDLQIAPGFFTLKTDRGANGRWKGGDKVRFHHGLPEKLGGWLRSGSDDFLGMCRALKDFLSLSFEKLIAAGTHSKLYIWKSGTFYDVTPIRATTNPMANNPFAMTNTSTTVTVTDVAHGATQGSYVTFSGAAAGAGITIDGEYQIQTIVDADNYTITHSAAATSTASGGGAAVVAAYQINIGSANSVYGLGYGAGTYGTSTYGTPRTLSNFLTSAMIWSLDTWGEDLIACPRGGAIYLWDTSVGVATRASAISGTPSTARVVFVAENKHLVVLGAHDGAADDPLLIKWSSSEDYTDFTASATNSAGEKRLTAGNEILCRLKMPKEDLILTDSHATAMRFTGAPNWFSFEDLGQNGSIRGQNAAIEANGIGYWMGEKNFFYYDGRVNVLPCEVWPTLFDAEDDDQPGLNFVQRAKTFAVYIRDFSEVWWLYCSRDSAEVDRYVAYNTLEKVWHFGTLARTAMIGNSDVFEVPFATGSNGYLYDHETGVDDDASAMAPYIDSGDMEIPDAGDYLMQVGMLVPDFKRLEGSVTMTMTAKKYPQDTDSQAQASITITSSTKYVNPRLKGRQISFRFASSAVGDSWRMGTLRIAARPHGKK